MSVQNVQLPSKPEVISEDELAGTYQIDGLYPGYGHTLGNSLRRIILSSLPGAAVTAVNIEGVSHEFSTIEGVKEDVITILLNLKKLRVRINTDEPQALKLKIKGPKEIMASDIEAPGQVEILNGDEYLASVAANTTLDMVITVEKGTGYLPKELMNKDRLEAGMIALNASFTPVKRVNYEVENMRVGDRTDFNRLKIFIETDGTMGPREALEKSIVIMIEQLKAVVGFKEEEPEPEVVEVEEKEEETTGPESIGEVQEEEKKEFLKTRIESLSLSTRTENALTGANIRTVGGLVRKKEEDILNLEGLGEKGLQEIKRVLGNYGIILK